MLKTYPPIEIRTNHPHPEESPDYLDPAGSVEDNHTNAYFIYELSQRFHGLPFRIMDLGCAGGQFVVDVYNKGAPWTAVGVEGGNVHGMTGSFATRKMETGLLSAPRGADNWRQYKDKCLFNADISKPFDIVIKKTTDPEWKDIAGQRMRFDIITAYEFLEHPLPTDIPQILENVKKHLLPEGIFIGTINLSPGYHHRCAKPVSWWQDIYEDHGLTLEPYPFQTSPRTGEFYLTHMFHQIQSRGPNLFLIDESVIPNAELHPPNIDPLNFEFDNQNLPFCARLKKENK